MKKVLVGIGCAIIFAFGFAASYVGLGFTKTSDKNPSATLTPTPISYSKVTPAPITNPKGVFNLLFLGYGGAGHAGSLLTDSIIIVHIDTNTNKAALISVPRDLWIPGNRKVNAEGSIIGFQNIGSSIQNITGTHIDYFVSVDFGGFTKIIDDIGGISVIVPKTFDDPFYPITGQENNTCGKSEDEINQLKAKYSGYQLETQFICRYEHLHFNQGPINLDGTTALKFVRSRHGDSDFGRSLRQFSVLVGIQNKLISLKSIGKLDQMIGTLFNIVRTDLNAGTIKTLLTVFGDPGKYKISQIQLSTDNVLNEGKSVDGQYILMPRVGNFNFSEIKNFINSNL